jgi:hypothetical protein
MKSTTRGTLRGETRSRSIRRVEVVSTGGLRRVQRSTRAKSCSVWLMAMRRRWRKWRRGFCPRGEQCRRRRSTFAQSDFGRAALRRGLASLLSLGSVYVSRATGRGSGREPQWAGAAVGGSRLIVSQGWAHPKREHDQNSGPPGGSADAPRVIALQRFLLASRTATSGTNF